MKTQATRHKVQCTINSSSTVTTEPRASQRLSLPDAPSHVLHTGERRPPARARKAKTVVPRKRRIHCSWLLPVPMYCIRGVDPVYTLGAAVQRPRAARTPTAVATTTQGQTKKMCLWERGLRRPESYIPVLICLRQGSRCISLSRYAAAPSLAVCLA